MQKTVDTPLTNEQQKLVSDNHNLIYAYARKHNLDLDEYYGILAIGLCKAALIFDSNLGFMFSTLAHVSMHHECYSYQRDMSRRKRYIPDELMMSLDAPVDDDPYSKELYDKIYDIFNDKYRTGVIKTELKDFIRTLRQTDQLILFYTFQGYEQKEIAAALGMTRANVNGRLHVLKKRWNACKYKTK